MGLVVLMGFLALAVDVGSLWTQRRQIQTVADAAAVAGMNALQSGLTCSSGSCPAAQDVAKINGYQDGVNGATVTAGPPGTPPASPANGTYVEVDVAQSVPTYFLRVLGYDTVNVSTRESASTRSACGY